MSVDTFFDIGIEPYYENKEHSIKLFHGDCLQLLPDGNIDWEKLVQFVSEEKVLKSARKSQ